MLNYRCTKQNVKYFIRVELLNEELLAATDDDVNGTGARADNDTLATG